MALLGLWAYSGEEDWRCKHGRWLYPILLIMFIAISAHGKRGHGGILEAHSQGENV